MAKVTKQRASKRFREDGQGLVEFALVAGLLLLLIVGGIDMYRLIYQKQALDQTARIAARAAAEYGGDAVEVGDLVTAQLTLLNANPESVTVTVAAYTYTNGAFTPTGNTRCQYGEFVGVTLQQPWQIAIPALGLFAPAISGNDTMTVQYLDKCWRSGE